MPPPTLASVCRHLDIINTCAGLPAMDDMHGTSSQKHRAYVQVNTVDRIFCFSTVQLWMGMSGAGNAGLLAEEEKENQSRI